MSDSPAVLRLLALAQEHKLNSGEDLLELSSQVTRPDALDEVELGRLNWSPRVNWVEAENGLPRYIEEVAIGIMKSGKTREQAIPMAINRIKRWAAGLDGVKADTQAKAVAALAAWEKMKASAAAKRAARRG